MKTQYEQRMKENERLLREERDFAYSLIATAQAIILVLDTEGRIVSFNPYMETMTGYSLEEVHGKDWFDTFLPGKDHDRMRDIFKEAVNDIQTRGNVNPILSRDGREIWVEWHDKTLKDADGRTTGVLAVGQDITRRLQMEREKIELEAQLRQAQKMEAIGTLAGGIAHDFNNILFPIVGYVEMMLGNAPEGSELRESLKEVFIAALRARDLVKQILAFSRQANKDIKAIPIQPVVREALNLMRAALPSTIKIDPYIDDDCGMVLADPTHIQQIAMNLTTNAFHAMEEDGGVLKVEVSRVAIGADDLENFQLTPGPFVRLSVSDTGIGMDKTVLDRIFEPYFSTKEKQKGTGLGLSVVHGIVKSYRGDIRVYSEPGKGSLFHVYLPVIERGDETRGVDVEGDIQGGDERVLLIDDEEPILRMEKKLLDSLGYQVIIRTSSLEALEAFRSSPDRFDLVITDMTMPNMTGDRLVIELKRIRKDIPVILCTGFSEKMSKDRAAALGINGFLMKPIIKSQLAAEVRKVLGKGQS